MPEHSHITRDIKPPGLCPACDDYHARHHAGKALSYTPPSRDVAYYTGRYDLDSIANRFATDPVASFGVHDLPRLTESEHWEDRVRAEVLRQRLKITLPDQFPCIYETADSPNQADHAFKRPHPWVVSPDFNMLERLLPDYQELWDCYTSQWGPTRRRTFAVGRLDGLKPFSVYAPGTTPEQVIGSTLLTHSDMYGRAPERLRLMHPRYTQRANGREDRP